MSKQTAVEWLIDKIFMTDLETFNFLAENGDFDQAKAMEKEQIKDATTFGNRQDCYDATETLGEQYYNETYKEDK